MKQNWRAQSRWPLFSELLPPDPPVATPMAEAIRRLSITRARLKAFTFPWRYGMTGSLTDPVLFDKTNTPSDVQRAMDLLDRVTTKVVQLRQRYKIYGIYGEVLR